MQKAEFLNCNFFNCNFADCDCKGIYLRECTFEACKGDGSIWQEAVLCRVTMQNCRWEEANFNHCVWEDCVFADSRFCMAAVSGFKIKKCRFACDFTRANFFKTPLKGVDFTRSIIDGLILSGEELKGVCVTAQQAAMLAGLFGIIVK